MSSDVDRTQALETAHDVDASATVLTRRWLAFIDVNGASVSCESSALADRSGSTLFTDATVFTWIRVAVATVLATLATQTGRAFATIIVIQIITTAIEKTRRRSARVTIDLASSAQETRPARALIAGECSYHFNASAAIQTRLSPAYT